MKRWIDIASNNVSSPRQFVALDGLRGIAALLVIFFHNFYFPTHITHNRFIGNSYLAVDVFFLLSGFIISKNYGNKIVNTDELLKFIWLRFCRLYPLHIMIIMVLVCMELTKVFAGASGLIYKSDQAPFTNTSSYSALVANIFLIHGLHVVDRLSWNIPSWSISCEFFAYLVFGLLALAGVLSNKLTAIVLIFAGSLSYCVLALVFSNLDITYDWGGVRCLAGFFLGSTLALQRKLLCRVISARALPILEVAVVGAVITLMSVVKGPAVLLVIPSFILMIILLQDDGGPIARILQYKLIQYLGRISYSIYMVQLLVGLNISILVKHIFHPPISIDQRTHQMALAINPWAGDGILAATIAVIIIISSITFELIETPGRKLGRRYASAFLVGTRSLRYKLLGEFAKRGAHLAASSDSSLAGGSTSRTVVVGTTPSSSSRTCSWSPSRPAEKPVP
jgi:peptidoglycan/LPS O-acetylase OafA/YrhL